MITKAPALNTWTIEQDTVKGYILGLVPTKTTVFYVACNGKRVDLTRHNFLRPFLTDLDLATKWVETREARERLVFKYTDANTFWNAQY